MAYLLIRDRDRTCGNPTKDARNWKRGMVVDVYEDTDPRQFKRPCPIPFVWIHLTNVTKAQALKYLSEHLNADGSLSLRRLYRVYWEDLPIAIRTELETNRFWEGTWQKLRAYVKNQVTGVSE